jgi:hypothetical protein
VLSYRFLYEKTVKCKMMSYSIIFPCWYTAMMGTGYYFRALK